jgi:hypothetical protein
MGTGHTRVWRVFGARMRSLSSSRGWLRAQLDASAPVIPAAPSSSHSLRQSVRLPYHSARPPGDCHAPPSPGSEPSGSGCGALRASWTPRQAIERTLPRASLHLCSVHPCRPCVPALRDVAERGRRRQHTTAALTHVCTCGRLWRRRRRQRTQWWAAAACSPAASCPGRTARRRAGRSRVRSRVGM